MAEEVFEVDQEPSQVEQAPSSFEIHYVALWWWTRGPAATLVVGNDASGAVLVTRP